jgi:hypothetical protein
LGHLVAPGVHEPVHAPFTQAELLHGLAEPHVPLDEHVSTPLPEHVVLPLAQLPQIPAPLQKPPEQAFAVAH